MDSELKAQLDRIEDMLMALLDALGSDDDGESLGGDEHGADRDTMSLL